LAAFQARSALTPDTDSISSPNKPEIRSKSQNTNNKTQTITNDQNSNVRNDSSDLCRGYAFVSVIESWNLIFVCHLALVIWDLSDFCRMSSDICHLRAAAKLEERRRVICLLKPDT
jgi:hypothetical protein